MSDIAKVELHCHMEGAASPDLVRRLAANYNLDLSRLFDDEGHYVWHDFQSFLHAYDGAASVLRSPRDYRDLTVEYFTSMAAEGGIYGEVFTSADHGAEVGMDYVDMVDGIAQGMSEAQQATGIVGRMILTCVRHLGPEKAIATARLLERYPHPMVVGFGMGGEERMGNPADFAPAFDIARGTGMRITSHAGELDGPQSVRDTLDYLKPERIGHGVRAIEDPDVVRRLADENIVLEVCPGSNVALGLYRDRASHPLIKLRDAGVKVTINSDDPPFFHTSIGREYDETAMAFAVSPRQMTEFSKTAVDAAFADPQTRQTLHARLGQR